MKTKIISFTLLLFLISFQVKAQYWGFVGLDTLIVKQLYISGDTLWAAADYFVGNQVRSNLYFSSDVGNSWVKIDSLLGNNNIYSFILIPPETLYVIKVGILYKSTNNGKTWTIINNVSSNPIKWFGVSPFNMKEMYAIDLFFAGGTHNNLYKSTNEGENWELLGPFPASSHGNELSFAFDYTDSLNLYVSDDDHWSSSYFFKSSDKGETWFYVSSPPFIPTAIYSDYFISSRVYLFPGPYVSNDSGYNWFLADSGLSSTSSTISFYQDKLATQLLYVLRTDGIFYSDPVSIFWQLLKESNSLPVEFSSMRTMTIEPTKKELFLGTNEGIYKTTILTIVKDYEDIGINFYLSQNYPNPFNPITVIKYKITIRSFITIKIYDTLGEEVKILENGEKLKGEYEVRFNGSELTSGVYFYILTAMTEDGQRLRKGKKMLLIK